MADQTEQQKAEQQQKQAQSSTSTPTPAAGQQQELDRRAQEGAQKSAKAAEQRTTQFYDHEDPTPTQAENDAAKLSVSGGGQQNPDFGQLTPEQHKKRMVEMCREAIEWR